MRATARLVLVSVLLLVAAPVAAHKLRVFASAEGASIQGSVYFAGGGPAAGARLRIEDAEGRLLGEPVSDDNGAFSFEAKAPVDHLVIAETGDGHRAQWRIEAAELAGGFPGALADAAPAPDRDPAARVSPAQSMSPSLDPVLIAALERAVARQVRPLREELSAERDRVAIRDVIGGLGYIFGLVGVLLWWRSRGHGEGR